MFCRRRSPKVLMVGGSRDLREKFYGWTFEESYILLFADDFHQALQTIHVEFPDVILCDSKAFTDPGLTLLKEPYKRIGIPLPYMVVLTNSSNNNQIQRCKDHSTDSLLTWPSQKQDLIKLIEAGCGKNHEQHQSTNTSAYHHPNDMLSYLPFKIRNPLNTIMGYSTLMSDANNRFEDNEIVEMSKSVMNAGHVLQTFIGKIDMYTQLDRYVSDPAQHVAKEVLSLVVFDEAFSVAGKYNRISDLLVDIKPRSIRIEALYFRTCIRELVDNAFRFSAPGSKVLIAGKLSGTSYMLNVFDQGRGHAFTSSACAADSAKNNTCHEQIRYGIGLNLVERILLQAGGSLDVKIETGKQTTVTCMIPLYVCEHKKHLAKQTVTEKTK